MGPQGLHLGYPKIESCNFAPYGRVAPVLVTSTDFATGALGRIDPVTKQVQPDLVLAHTDTALAHDPNRVFLINRFGADAITILANDPQLSWQGEFSVGGPGPSSNPHDAVVDAQGLLHVSFLGRDHLSVYNISSPSAPSLVRNVDLSSFSDADGLPEASSIIPCNDVYFIEIQRLNRKDGWTPVDHSYLVPINMRTGKGYDFTQSGAQTPSAIKLHGHGVAGWLPDPQDRTNRQILVLNRGLERIDLATGTSSILIPEQIFDNMGIPLWDVRSLALSPDLASIWIMVIDQFPTHTVYEASWTGQGQDLRPILSGIQSVTGSMKVLGQELWIADTTPQNPGVRIFEYKDRTLHESPLSPISVGLAPYLLHVAPGL